MSSRNSTDWMWSQACELIEQAERMHRQFFRLLSSERAQAVWEPPVDVFEDEREVTIIIALPGVPAGCIEVNEDRKSTRLNSSHSQISYAVFCLKKKKQSE